MPAWNGWYHLMAGTYGAWPAGDARGVRTRHHREHIEGDYKNPPPRGKYDAVLRRSRELMKRDAVRLSPAARVAAVEAILAALRWHHIEVIAISVSAMHLHLLARFAQPTMNPTASRRRIRHRDLRHADPPRYFLGIAKERSAKSLAAAGLVPAGGIWAKRGKVRPVEDRRHQVNVYRYIVDHDDEGAAVWCHLREEVVIRPDAQ